jgi:hypothetical protein
MKAQDKQKPVTLTVRVHPEVMRLARALGEFYDDSDVDHIVSEAVRDAAGNKKFAEWLAAHPNVGNSKEETPASAKPGRKEAA